MLPNAPAEGPRRPAESGPWGAAEGPVAHRRHRPLRSSWAMAAAGVAGGRRWRASLAGVAGGRRRRSRTKIAVMSIKGTKTRHTHKPRKQSAHSERRWLTCHTTAEHSREDTIYLDRASQIERTEEELDKGAGSKDTHTHSRGRAALEAKGFRVRRLPVGFCLRFFVFL